MARSSHQCRICDTPLAEFGTKRSWFDGSTYTYYRCDNCGFICVLPFPGYGVYNDDYYAGKGPDPFVDYEAEYRDYRATRRMLEFNDLYRVVGKELGTNLSSARWLDFGCGAGGLMKFLADKNREEGVAIEIVGYDIGTYARRLHDEGMKILGGSDLVHYRGYFDVITCVEVVEHVYETQDLFRTLSDLLRPGGLLIVTTGNMASFAARSAGINYRYMMPEIHISLFTPKALELLYQRNGLAPFAVHYDGVVRFKVVKSLLNPMLNRMASVAFALSFLVRLIDRIYGVSAMPCARKIKVSTRGPT
ncbi:MAG: class I SAM-dependent methyltransferase [Opitutaceae bacterium]|nr:class I SAM-dependent methyltransferase [Opitutaceae bacterium]